MRQVEEGGELPRVVGDVNGVRMNRHNGGGGDFEALKPGCTSFSSLFRLFISSVRCSSSLVVCCISLYFAGF